MATTSKEAKAALSYTATGKAGATATPSIQAGGTTAGAPTTGAHIKGEFVFDDAGKLYFCTVAGTPGTWVLVPTVSTYVWNGAAYAEDTDLRIFIGPAAQNPTVAAGGRSQANDLWLDDGTAPPAFGIGIDDPTIFASVFGAANADDQEFDTSGSGTSSLPSGWSWVNQGTATYTERGGAGVIAGPAAAGINWRGIVRNIPAGSAWTATVKRKAITQTANEHAHGIVLREAATGKLLTFYWYEISTDTTVNGQRHYLVTWTSVTGGSAVVVGPLYVRPVGQPPYMRIVKNSATSFDFQVSYDGLAWTTIVAAHNPSAITYDQIGIMGYCSGTMAWQTAIEWYRVR